MGCAIRKILILLVCTAYFAVTESQKGDNKARLNTHPVHDKTKDGMHSSEKLTVGKLILELIKEMRLSYRQVHAIRIHHLHRIGYEVGSVIGRMRELYKRIMDHYKELIDRRVGRNQMYPPGLWWNRPYHWMIGVQLIKGLEMEIDKMIQVLETIPMSILKSESNVDDDVAATKQLVNNNPASPGQDTQLRQGPEREEGKTDNSTFIGQKEQSENPLLFENEEELKRYYREQYEREHNDGKDKEWSLDKDFGLIRN